MGLRSSTTTHKAFQHLKAPPVITKLVFKLETVGDKLLVRFSNVLRKAAKRMLFSG